MLIKTSLIAAAAAMLVTASPGFAQKKERTTAKGAAVGTAVGAATGHTGTGAAVGAAAGHHKKKKTERKKQEVTPYQ